MMCVHASGQASRGLQAARTAGVAGGKCGCSKVSSSFCFFECGSRSLCLGSPGPLPNGHLFTAGHLTATFSHHQAPGKDYNPLCLSTAAALQCLNCASCHFEQLGLWRPLSGCTCRLLAGTLPTAIRMASVCSVLSGVLTDHEWPFLVPHCTWSHYTKDPPTSLTM